MKKGRSCRKQEMRSSAACVISDSTIGLILFWGEGVIYYGKVLRSMWCSIGRRY